MYAEGAGLPQDDVAAAQWYRKAAEQGFALAQRELGRLYAAGSGVRRMRSRRSAGTARRPRRAMPRSEYLLAFAYARGQGVPADQAQAASWNRKAAEHGYALAQYQLRRRLPTARACRQDAAEAARWFQAAAAQGNADAEFNLAVLYSAGSGVARDYAQAVHWFQAAADQGSVAARVQPGRALLPTATAWPVDLAESGEALRGGGAARTARRAVRARRHVPG